MVSNNRVTQLRGPPSVKRLNIATKGIRERKARRRSWSGELSMQPLCDQHITSCEVTTRVTSQHADLPDWWPRSAPRCLNLSIPFRDFPRGSSLLMMEISRITHLSVCPIADIWTFFCKYACFSIKGEDLEMSQLLKMVGTCPEMEISGPES